MTSAAYAQSAALYDLIYDFKDFPATTARLRELIAAHAPAARSILDVGCGTGRHLELLGPEFERVGIDLSEEMLAVARRRCPDVDFWQADMTAIDLGRRFDVVTCLFSAVAYVRTVERLDEAVARMAAHLGPDGLLLLEPWLSPERYWVGHLAVNHAERDGVSVSWMYVQELVDGCSRFDIHYLVGSPQGVVHFEERHEMGLFTDDEYVAALRAAGLQTAYDPEGLFGRGLYVASAG
jgi:SAM-dependent methyltransferase